MTDKVSVVIASAALAEQQGKGIRYKVKYITYRFAKYSLKSGMIITNISQTGLPLIAISVTSLVFLVQIE